MQVRGLVVVAVAVACSLVVVLGSGAAAGGGTQKSDEPCLESVLRLRQAHPRLLHTAPPAVLTSVLEVLRRPAGGEDRLPAGGSLGAGYSTVWTDYVRFVATVPGQTRFFLIPGVFDLRLPAVCVRSLTLSARRRYETEAREQRAGSVTIEAFGSEGRLGAIPYPAQAIEAGRALLAMPGSSDATLLVSGVVPDGVASVTLTPANGKTATVPAASNFFVTQAEASNQRSLVIRWHAADGSLIKTIRIERVPVSTLPATGGPTEITIPLPPAVAQAGGQQLAEFEQGRTVTAQSGCLACHRIGQSGNPGPGPALTHVGSVLSRRGIEHALIDPTAPMPSFKRLPPAKFKALVTFLSELR
jgi:mono/diheme cytochrome c family protein